ncbi:MAG: FHA domain-containing protein [Actinomycetota bacterium]
MPLKVTYQGQDTVVDDGSTVVIGSDAASTIRIVRPGISRRHAVVTHTASGWKIEDAGSRNGSYRFGQRFETVPINGEETVYLGHPTDGEKVMLDLIKEESESPDSDAPVIETFVLPESAPAKKITASKPKPAPKKPKPVASDDLVPPSPAMTPPPLQAPSQVTPPDTAAARSRAQRTPREVDLAELTNALRDQINAVKGLTWSVWAMIAVTAALAIMTLFVGILGS